MNITVKLYYEDILVANVTEPCRHQGTWFGMFELLISGEDGERQSRILDFIEFCKDWHDRIEHDLSNPPDAEEFDQFEDLMSDRSWSIWDNGADCKWISDLPTFIGGNEMSWQVVGADDPTSPDIL